MTVGEIMTKDVITVGMDDTVNQIRKLFDRHKFHHVLVQEDDSVVGIISDRDILGQISPHADSVRADAHALNTLQKKAHQIMTRAIRDIRKETLVEEAAKIILEEGLSCLPVLSDTGEVEGILAWKDLLKYYVTKG